MKKFSVEREDYINKTFRLPIKLVNKMERVRELKNVSLNNLVYKCIVYALENSDMDIPDDDTENKK